ncbi:tyrosine-type recombinase/integrase [Micromonospora sp. U21]|uniref:tyrosine-type recombinase/integrase n=1 Tax=Micromonospora sp. U21 TaxID=2824899 RepID=UPI001FFC63C5|nr:tyrosine-type recombinase/integrase [Micromonospora sp. U21]
MHDLRHSAATIALDAGIDIKVVSEQLGHSTTTLTRDTYQSVTKRMHQDAADAVAKKMGMCERPFIDPSPRRGVDIERSILLAQGNRLEVCSKVSQQGRH